MKRTVIQLFLALIGAIIALYFAKITNQIWRDHYITLATSYEKFSNDATLLFFAVFLVSGLLLGYLGFKLGGRFFSKKE